MKVLFFCSILSPFSFLPSFLPPFSLLSLLPLPLSSSLHFPLSLPVLFLLSLLSLMYYVAQTSLKLLILLPQPPKILNLPPPSFFLNDLLWDRYIIMCGHIGFIYVMNIDDLCVRRRGEGQLV